MTLNFPIDGIKAVDYSFHLCGYTKIIHWCGENHHVGLDKMRTEFTEIIVEYARAVHTATVARAAWLHLLEGTVETIDFMTFFFRSFYEPVCEISRVPVTAGAAREYYYFHFILF